MEYAYLLFTSLFLVPWAIIFIVRKDTRKEMLWAGVIIAIMGLISEKVWYTKDWVNPTTITGTIIGIEDAIMGFAAGGIAAVIYKEVFKRDNYKCRTFPMSTHWLIIACAIFGLIIADSLFRFFGIFSYYANLIGFGLIALVTLIIRKDLIKESVTGGYC